MVDRDRIRRAYDELGEVYVRDRLDDDQGTEILDRFLDGIPEQGFVLDAGCGGGRPVLARLATSVAAVGLDLSHEQLRVAAETVPGAPLVQGDMTTLPFARDTFDGVVAYWSLIHVPMADHATVLEEFARVLKPGGRVLVCEGTEAWRGENPDWLDSGVRMAWDIAGEETTREHLRAVGFEVTDEYRVGTSLASEKRADESGENRWTVFAARLPEDDDPHRG